MGNCVLNYQNDPLLFCFGVWGGSVGVWEALYRQCSRRKEIPLVFFRGSCVPELDGIRAAFLPQFNNHTCASCMPHFSQTWFMPLKRCFLSSTLSSSCIRTKVPFISGDWPAILRKKSCQVFSVWYPETQAFHGLPSDHGMISPAWPT